MASVGEVRIWLDKAIENLTGNPGAMPGIQVLNEVMGECVGHTTRIKTKAEQIGHQTISHLPSYAELIKSDVLLNKKNFDEKMIPVTTPVLQYLEQAMSIVQAAADGTQNEQLKTASASIQHAKTKMEECTGALVQGSASAGDLMIVPNAHIGGMADQVLGSLAVAQTALETVWVQLMNAVGLIQSYVPGL